MVLRSCRILVSACLLVAAFAAPAGPVAASRRPAYPVSPDDPLFDAQWGLRNISAPEAWEHATGRGIKVGFVDSGVWLDHEDLACPGKLLILPGSNLGSKRRPNKPNDTIGGHGTMMAGVVGACTDNGKGIAGVAPDSTLVPARIMRLAQQVSFDETMARGIDFATRAGVHVINLSLGPIPPESHLGPDAFPKTERALHDAREEGVVITAAAGNYAQPTCEYPALSRNVICVVATDRLDLRGAYSDFAVNVDRNADVPGLEPVVAAPGGQGTSCAENVLSTYPTRSDPVCHPKGYQSAFGTSLSAPHVAGVAALLYELLGGVRSEANADFVVETIVETADDLYTPGWDPIVGHGRVNAAAAVEALATR